LISQAGAAGGASTGWFLAGFFSAGVLWCVVLCLVACQGGKLLGERLLRYCYWISAVIFAYFAVIVMTSGYAEFITAGA
jgi:L-lysine exporter family protein LysE/ArgO